MPHPHHSRFQIPLLFILLGSLALFGSPCQAQGDQAEPHELMRLMGKPATLGYISTSDQPIAKDLLHLPMARERTGLMRSIDARMILALRRTITKASADPVVLDSLAPPVAWLHLHRKGLHHPYAIHQIDETTLALVHPSPPTQAWRIDFAVFRKITGLINLTPPAPPEPPEPPTNTADQSTLPTSPPIRSSIVLDRKTIRARIKRSYPPLSPPTTQERYRYRLPKNHNPEFPAGVLVWISPSLDGRIPQIFEPILDKLGLIAIGIDNNGNKRPITDRLQNHLDSIDTLFRIDHNRIYLTGMSGGGRCSTILLTAFPDHFAGAVPIVGMDSHHKTPTGKPGLFWPAGVGKPTGRLMKLLQTRRIAAITGSADFNQPEMTKRTELLKRDKIDIRLDIIEGMAHTIPTDEQFADALDWVDQPRRSAMVKDFKQAKSILNDFHQSKSDPQSPAARKQLIEIITLAPWTQPADEAWSLLDYPKED